MVALATLGEKAFVPSLLEAPEVAAGAGPVASRGPRIRQMRITALIRCGV